MKLVFIMPVKLSKVSEIIFSKKKCQVIDDYFNAPFCHWNIKISSRGEATFTYYGISNLYHLFPGCVSSNSPSDLFITHVEAGKLLNSLLKLRQACCHPQVGSSGLRSLQQAPMTMEEILSVGYM